MADHGITAEDTMVRGYPGTIARCLCGWDTAWSVRDGSAEADGHAHVMRCDPEAKAASEAFQAVFLAERRAWDAANKARYDPPPTGPQPAVAEHSHECSCHLGAPCGRCENCKHPAGDFEDCPNDCQECEVEHDY